MAEIDKKTLEHLLDLARLDVAEGEKHKLLKDLEAILGYVAMLSEADTKGVEPMTGGTQLESILREDEVDIDKKRRSISEAGRVIEAFPSSRDGYLETPPVF